MSNIRRMTPEDVAKYAQQDSRALSEVADTDILEELKIRLNENATWPAEQLAKSLYDLWKMNKEEEA